MDPFSRYMYKNKSLNLYWPISLSPLSGPTPPPSISSTHDRPSVTVTLRRRSSSSIPAPRTHGCPSREERYFPIFVPWNGLEHYLICPLSPQIEWWHLINCSVSLHLGFQMSLMWDSTFCFYASLNIWILGYSLDLLTYALRVCLDDLVCKKCCEWHVS